MQTIKIKSIYPITFTREIEKELDLDTFKLELEDYLKDFYDNEISKKTLEHSIKSLCWDIQSSVLEIMGTNVTTAYITCPANEK